MRACAIAVDRDETDLVFDDDLVLSDLLLNLPSFRSFGRLHNYYCVSTPVKWNDLTPEANSVK